MIFNKALKENREFHKVWQWKLGEQNFKKIIREAVEHARPNCIWTPTTYL